MGVDVVDSVVVEVVVAGVDGGGGAIRSAIIGTGENKGGELFGGEGGDPGGRLIGGNGGLMPTLTEMSYSSFLTPSVAVDDFDVLRFLNFCRLLDLNLSLLKYFLDLRLLLRNLGSNRSITAAA